MKIRTATLGIAVLALAFAFAACSKGSPEAKIVGTWGLDAEATLENSGEEMSDEEREMAMTMFAAMSMTFTFEEGGAVNMSMTSPFSEEAETKAGTYEVLSVDGDTVTIKLTEEEGDEKEFTITFHGDDSMSMSEGDEEMYFSRQ